MGVMQRHKGASGERELFKMLSAELGFVVIRHVTECGESGCSSVSIPGFAIDVKRQEIPFSPSWMQQAMDAAQNGEIPLVFYRRNYQPWQMFIRTADLLGEPVYTGMAVLEFADAVNFIREHLPCPAH